jgi:hypothetical protein
MRSWRVRDGIHNNWREWLRCDLELLREEPMDHFWLSDERFANIAPHLPIDTRSKPCVDDGRMISDIITW